MAPNSFNFRHDVGFEDTNLVGNVYFANHVRWQGRCRELFLREHASDVLAELERDLALVTLSVSCHYLAELRAFDTVEVRMTLGAVTQNRLTLHFEYVRLGASEERVARGEQVVASMRRTDTGLVPCPLPDSLRQAIKRYAVH